MQILRDYQDVVLHKLRVAIRDGYKSLLIVLPTGGGKTTVAAHVIQGAIAKGHTVMFLAHRKELIDQCSERLDQHGVDHGIIKAGNKRVAPNLKVQVVSVMTLIRRTKNRPDAKIFFIDEAHRAMAKSYLKVLEVYPNSIVIGLTATPFRLDGKGLGNIFEKIVECSSCAELTDRGYLVPARVFSAPMLPAFNKIKKIGGDYAKDDLEKAVNRSSIIGNIYAHWDKYAHGRLTIVFAVTRIHARSIQESFSSHGVVCDYIDGDMPDKDRSEVLGKFRAGITTVMVNVGILTEGYDLPEVSCIVLARPTQSLALYLQMVGRGLRTHIESGKTNCIVLDHGGNTMVHGFVTDERVYDLDGVAYKEKDAAADKVIKTCEQCYCTYCGMVCPECGHKNAIKANSEVKEIDGELIELNPKEINLKRKRYLHEQLRKQFACEYKSSYAAVRFKERFGMWPNKQLGVKPIFKWNMAERKSKITGYDYSVAIKEAGIDIARREKSAERNLITSVEGTS